MEDRALGERLSLAGNVTDPRLPAGHRCQTYDRVRAGPQGCVKGSAPVTGNGISGEGMPNP